MFGDLRLAEMQAMHHVADWARPVTQELDDLKTAGLGQRSECGHHGACEYASKRIFLSRHILVKEYTKRAFHKRPRAGGLPKRLEINRFIRGETRSQVKAAAAARR